ncbi:MAG: phosphoglycerate kinase [candidate division WOR-3 bacterium]|nr:phosphoglycerate kinase [candidate division WOR-3 bacterium]MDW8150070.1 phosphoglycerate kinase [candidate division WOR-3 bacterium]
MKVLSILDIDKNLLKGKRIFLRVDFNVPIENDIVVDDYRIIKSLATIRYLLDLGCILILASHLSRPKGINLNYSLKPVAKHLSNLLNKEVKFIEIYESNYIDYLKKVQNEVLKLKSGDVLVLENLRFSEGEEKNDTTLIDELYKLGEIYVNDAFGTSHRKHASVYGLALKYNIRLAGILMKNEIDYLYKVKENPTKPFYSIIGGAKVIDKIKVLENLIKVSDKMLIGGAMAYTFLKVKNVPIGNSLVDSESFEFAKEFLEKYQNKVILPIDHVVKNSVIKEVENIEENYLGMDIGSRTIELFKKELSNAKMIFWNGPLGKFEEKEFSNGTIEIAKYLSKLTKDGTITVIGGGDTVSAIHMANLKDEDFSHVSTGGGATLEFISGEEMPGIEVLKNV